VYDVVSGTFSMTAAMAKARALQTATLFTNGKVLVAGGDSTFYGWGSASRSISATEVFDPATGTFAAAPAMASPRESHTATLLTNGAILITGGGNGTIGYSPTTVLASSDLYAWH
jgi:hypothetical protein